MKEILYKINPDRSNPWNTMPLLPINVSLYKQIDVLEALVEAKTSLGKLQGRSIAIADPSILINSILLQEAKNSAEIENVFTTQDELFKAYGENKNENMLTGGAKEVLYYREAIWQGFHLLANKINFDIDYYSTLPNYQKSK